MAPLASRRSRLFLHYLPRSSVDVMVWGTDWGTGVVEVVPVCGEKWVGEEADGKTPVISLTGYFTKSSRRWTAGHCYLGELWAQLVWRKYLCVFCEVMQEASTLRAGSLRQMFQPFYEDVLLCSSLAVCYIGSYNGQPGRTSFLSRKKEVRSGSVFSCSNTSLIKITYLIWQELTNCFMSEKRCIPQQLHTSWSCRRPVAARIRAQRFSELGPGQQRLSQRGRGGPRSPSSCSTTKGQNAKYSDNNFLLAYYFHRGDIPAKSAN